MTTATCGNQPCLHASPDPPAAFFELVSFARLVRGAGPDGSRLDSGASAESLRQMIIEVIDSPKMQERFLAALEIPLPMNR